ncbi:site-specific integrase [Ferrimonas pelagia]|uniref:Site-specific integrase n=1 Tax=Ferrimonas pelagia TaxID=1177826 RepID=A0ABP9ELG4_9GAMM
MSTLTGRLSEASIKRAMADATVTALTDPRYPLTLRPHRARRSASWYLVLNQQGKTRRFKLGSWPALTVAAVLDELPSLIAMFAKGEQPNLNDWTTVGQLLRWYRDRALVDRSLSDKRRTNIKSSVDKHLLPALGAERIDELSHALVDTEYFLPMQSRYGLGTVRAHFAVLKRAFRQADKLQLLARNPLASLVFSDFTDGQIRAKASRLKSGDLPRLMAQLARATHEGQTLCGVMLALGTRIGETRQLRWRHLDEASGLLVIPAELTKSDREHRLPVTPYLTSILQAHRLWQERMLAYYGPFLFPRRSATSRLPLTETQANDLVRCVSGGEWTAHDLRKLARTSWADLGVDYHVAESLLNHALSKLDQAYIHSYVEEQKRLALTQWHTHLIAISRGADSDTMPTPTENSIPPQSAPLLG